MRLIEDIVDLLSDEQKSLNAALLKTKVLLHTLEQKDLAEWLNKELNGYDKSDEIPQYRKLRAAVHGNVRNIAEMRVGILIPIRVRLPCS